MSETLRIERMGTGAEAVAHRADGKAVFVEGGVPGDLAEVEVYEEKARFCRGRVTRLVEASNLRAGDTKPQVGAPWAHLGYEAQLDAKRSNVVDALERTAHLDPDRVEGLVEPCLPSKREWGYRNKLELHVGSDAAGRLLLGMQREGSHEIDVAESYPIAYGPLAKAGKSMQGALRYAQGAGDLKIHRVGLRASQRTRELEVALWAQPGPFPRAMVAKTVGSALRSSSVVRVLAEPGQARKVKGVETLSGAGCWHEEFCGFPYRVTAPSFFQVNTSQAEKLVAEVVRGFGGSVENRCFSGLEGMAVADLYAGCGSFSIPLAAAGAQVVAVESAGSSVRDLRHNADENGVDVEVVGGDAARELPGLGDIDALVVDPPRAGLAPEVIESTAELAPAHVAYVSCDPATWARDVARFEERGYALERVQPVDLFPQTWHVEVASILRRA